MIAAARPTCIYPTALTTCPRRILHLPFCHKILRVRLIFPTLPTSHRSNLFEKSPSGIMDWIIPANGTTGEITRPTTQRTSSCTGTYSSPPAAGPMSFSRTSPCTVTTAGGPARRAISSRASVGTGFFPRALTSSLTRRPRTRPPRSCWNKRQTAPWPEMGARARLWPETARTRPRGAVASRRTHPPTAETTTTSRVSPLSSREGVCPLETIGCPDGARSTSLLVKGYVRLYKHVNAFISY